jgi:hypothetical protein
MGRAPQSRFKCLTVYNGVLQILLDDDDDESRLLSRHKSIGKTLHII